MPYAVTVFPAVSTIYEDQVLYLFAQNFNDTVPEYIATRQRSNILWYNRSLSQLMVGEDTKQQFLRISPPELGFQPGNTYVIYAHGQDPERPTDAADSPDVTVTVLAGSAPRKKIWAISGFPEDIQAAIEAVDRVGDVFVPEGEFIFDLATAPTVTADGGIGIYGANTYDYLLGRVIDKTILHVPRSPPYTGLMFNISADNGLAGTRVAGISFKGFMDTGDESLFTSALMIGKAPDFRVYNCRFNGFSSASMWLHNMYMPMGLLRGLVDHCDLDNTYKDWFGGLWGYGVAVNGNYHVWEPIDYYLGKFDRKHDIVYVEDCNINRCRHGVVGNTSIWFVARWCKFGHPRPYTFAMIDNHGCWSHVQWCSDWNSTNPSLDRATCEAIPGNVWYRTSAGGRGFEAYENVITGEVDPVTGKNYSIAMAIRGGGGIAYHNTIYTCQAPGIRYFWGAIQFIFEPGATGEIACANPERTVNKFYAWDNIFVGSPHPYGTDGTYTQGLEYFIDIDRPTGPELAKDGFTWTPYTYPHPFTLETPPTPPLVTTTLTRKLEEGTYEVSVPDSILANGKMWVFEHWSDDLPPYNIGATREVNLTTAETLIATYVESAETPPTECPFESLKPYPRVHTLVCNLYERAQTIRAAASRARARILARV